MKTPTRKTIAAFAMATAFLLPPVAARADIIAPGGFHPTPPPPTPTQPPSPTAEPSASPTPPARPSPHIAAFVIEGERSPLFYAGIAVACIAFFSVGALRSIRKRQWP